MAGIKKKEEEEDEIKSRRPEEKKRCFPQNNYCGGGVGTD